MFQSNSDFDLSLAGEPTEGFRLPLVSFDGGQSWQPAPRLRMTERFTNGGYGYRTAYRVLSNPYLVEILLMAWRHR